MRTTLGRLAGTAFLFFAIIQPSFAQEMPQRGASQAAVEQRFGTPLKKHAPVGTPAITRWDYQDYSVYFEGNTALHAVSHEQAVVRRNTTEAAEAVNHDNANIRHHGTVVALPDIEETTPADTDTDSDTVDESEAAPEAQPEPQETPAQEADDEKEDWDGSFRFDPVTGRIVPTSGDSDEAPAEGNAEDTETSQEDEQNLPEEAADADEVAEEEAAEEAAEEEAAETTAVEDTEAPTTEEAPEEVIEEAPAEDETEHEDSGGGFQMSW